MKPEDKIIAALDVPDVESALPIIEELAPHVGWFKVGLELITAGYAPKIVDIIQDARGKVFYDGKFMDIPNTVGAASREATRLGSNMFNVHCLSGREAMEVAAKTARETHEEDKLLTGDPPIVLGVTLLTSLDSKALGGLSIFRRDWNLKDMVVTLALAAQQSGLHGVVASPLEIEFIRNACDSNFLIVTPGVRPAGTDVGDQRRVMTPGQAIEAGADHLVIGRPILKPENGTRVEAAQRIAEEIAQAMG